MIKALILVSLLDASEMEAIKPSSIRIEANRKRGKQYKGRRRPGGGLR